MKLILALCAAALVSAATEDSNSSRNSVPTGATPDPIYGSDNLGNIDYESILFGSVKSEEVQRLGFTDDEMSAYANQFQNWLTSRREGRIYPAGIDEIIDDKSIAGGKEAFNLTEERRTYFNNLLRKLVDEQTKKDVFNLPPGPAATASSMPAASTQLQPPSNGADGSSSSSSSSSSLSTSAGNQPGATVPTGMPGFPGNTTDDDITLTMSSAANGTSVDGSGAAGLNATGALGSAGLNSTGNGTRISRNSTGSGAAGRNGTRNDTVSSRTSAAGAARAVQEWTIAGGIAAAALCLLL